MGKGGRGRRGKKTEEEGKGGEGCSKVSSESETACVAVKLSDEAGGAPRPQTARAISAVVSHRQVEAFGHAMPSGQRRETTEVRP